MSGNEGYLALVRTPGVARLILPMVLARLPIGATTVLLVLFVSLRFGALQAGLASSAMTLGTALAAPLLGRVVDRGRGPVALIIASALQLVLIILLVAAVKVVGNSAAAVLLAFASGVSTPPVAGTTRALWPRLVPERLLSVAYSFEVGLIDVLYVTGPLVASAFIAAGAPEAGLIFVVTGQFVGAALLAASGPVRAYAAEGCAGGCSRAAGRSRLLSAPGVAFLLLICLATNAFSGALETVVPLWYSHLGQSNISGIVISVWSVGSILGVIAFARFQPNRHRVSLTRQLCLFTSVYLVATLACELHGSFVPFLVGAAIIGLTVSPCTNLHYQLSGELAPRSRHAEMFSWVNTATSAGISLGSFCVGIVVDGPGFDAAFLLSSIFVAMALAFSWVLRMKLGDKEP